MVRVELRDHVAIWTIDRPDSKNALDQATFEALSDAIASADSSVRAGIITGARDTFVSGGDLRELRNKTSREDAERLTDTGHALCEAIDRLPFPVIAAIGGAAIGGGAELAVACDMRVADHAATISFKQARLGVTTAWGTVPRLVALVGAGQAARLLCSAKTVSADDAFAIGLVDVVESGALGAAMDLAKDIAQCSPRAVAGMKMLVKATKMGADVRALERASFVETWSAADHLEAVAAWFERRPPRWTDR